MFGNTEFMIVDYDSNKVKLYDFTIPALKIIIEFHGISFHCNASGVITNNFLKLDDEKIKQNDERKKNN